MIPAETDKTEYAGLKAMLDTAIPLLPTPLALAVSRIQGEADPYSNYCFHFTKNLSELIIKMLYASLYAGAVKQNPEAARRSIVGVMSTVNWQEGFASLLQAGFPEEFNELSQWSYSKMKPGDPLLESFNQLNPVLEAVSKSTAKNTKVVDLFSRLVDIRNANAHGADGPDFHRIANIPLLRCVQKLLSCPAFVKWKWVFRSGEDAKALLGYSPVGIEPLADMPEGISIVAPDDPAAWFSIPMGIILCNHEATDFFVLNEKADGGTHRAQFLNYGRSLGRIPVNLAPIFTGQSDSVQLPVLTGVAPKIFWQEATNPPTAPPESQSEQTDPKNIPDTVPLPIDRKILADAVLAGLTERKIQIITGSTGMGKTELAKAVAGKIQDTYDVAWWISVADTGVGAQACIEESLTILGTKLCCSVKDLTKAIAGKRTLFVLDDVTEPADVKALLSAIKSADIVITSTNANWSRYGKVHEIGAFTVAEAGAFVQQRLQSTEEAQVNELVLEMGCLPLALEQAVSFIEARSMSVMKFIELFRKRVRPILGDSSTTAEHAPLAISLDMVLEGLAKESKGAARMFSLFCFTHTENIPLVLFQQSIEGLPEDIGTICSDEFLLEGSIANMRRYSLLRRKGSSITIHRLIQRLVIERLPHSEKIELATAALCLFRSLYNISGRDPRTWSVVSRLLPYAIETVDQAWGVGVTTEDSLQILLNLARVLSDQHQRESAEYLYKQALTIVPETNDGNKNPRLAVLSGLAVCSSEGGDFDQAKRYHEEILSLTEDFNSPEYAISLQNIAGLSTDQGDYLEAIRYRKQAIKIAETTGKVPPEEHGRFLNSLGMDYLLFGDAMRAEGTLKQAVTFQRANLPADHPDIAETLNHLAMLSNQRKKPARAEEYFREAIAVLDRGETDFDLARAVAYKGLARCLSVKGNHAEAQNLMQKAIEMFQFFKPEPLVLAECSYMLGAMKIDTSDFKESERLLHTALTLYQQHGCSKEIQIMVLEELVLLYKRSFQMDKAALFQKQRASLLSKS
jgi:tetratricopeptide (TPR) repeat protein